MNKHSTATFEVQNYVIYKKRIGKGAFSTVYKGYNKINKLQVAIKEITLDTLNKHKKMFKRETDIMMKLKHPNIITLYDTIIDENTENVYLIMDYYSRGDFSNFLRKRPLKEKYAVKYLKQLSEGLKYLLSNNIIHRDLKPQNILITGVGDIKITDFGFARYFDNDLLIQTICGSPLYMAPEIMKSQKYDYKSDLWSVGIIFYEMLVGNTPFKSKNIYELIRKIENDEVKVPSKFKLSINCQNLLYSLLKKNPEERISWEEFFDHTLLRDVDFNERENNLMEISNLDYLPSLPSNENKFINSSYQLYENTNMNNQLVNNKTINDSDIDLGLQFNFNLEEEDDEDEKGEEDNEIFYDSYETLGGMSFNELDIDDTYFKHTESFKRDLKNSLLKEFIVIENIKSNHKKNMSSSFKNYLNNSLYFFKESYKYIKNFNSL
tara:strand:+ start:2334 stop:3641 length:1308 start_codon:yes stop_codon:yes gene_type:complete